MKKREAARRLLYALSEVSDVYIEEAAQWKEAGAGRGGGRASRRAGGIRLAAAIAACLVVALAGLHAWGPEGLFEPEGQERVACNPVEEVSTLAEAEALTGFGLTWEGLETGYEVQSIVVYDGAMIEVNLENPARSGEGIYLRKASSAGDVSGDHSAYAVERAVNVAGRNAVLKGEAEGWYLATWQKDGYAYALGAQGRSLSTEEMQALISAIDIKE